MLANIKNRRIRESVGEFMKIKIEIFNNLDTIARAVMHFFLLNSCTDMVLIRRPS